MQRFKPCSHMTAAVTTLASSTDISSSTTAAPSSSAVGASRTAVSTGSLQEVLVPVSPTHRSTLPVEVGTLEPDAGDPRELRSETTYVVERILNRRKLRRGGGWEYQVKWLGWDADEDITWEPAAHLHPQLISSWLSSVE
eukprot:1919447-Prymnesium_polylepis.1